ncbi:MAG: hypothetical protein HFF18_01920 [Oscillospiraceae bacterium]|nr:hypothetical protein [Oscillospiraceae bacterium]
MLPKSVACGRVIARESGGSTPLSHYPPAQKLDNFNVSARKQFKVLFASFSFKKKKRKIVSQ